MHAGSRQRRGGRLHGARILELDYPVASAALGSERGYRHLVFDH